MKESLRPFGLSGSALKMIAIITMLVDHTGATIIKTILNHPTICFYPEKKLFWETIYKSSRDIGRLAFPIFCFLIVEGFLHTRNEWKYAGRLFLFALISEIPFDIALKGSWIFTQKQNVYFTLLFGLLTLIAIRRLTFSLTRYPILAVLPVAIGMKIAAIVNTDYNYKGVFLIAILYLFNQDRLYQCIGGAVSVSWELPAPLAFLPVYLYNGTRGRQMKYFFYWFYPVHLMLLYGISKYILPAIL